ncbi:hypothetical protein AcV5_003615 [Taiwanofungus camphoratus]|nr:hypothetical protein AcV5_003615 [Antrodia cinnamomea]
MAPNFLSRNFTFWGSVGAVMAALKLKEHLDDYNQLPTEEDGLGRVALHSPNASQERVNMFRDGSLDTEIPVTRLRRKKADCCVCCGIRCGLFWKAFGIVCLILVSWQSIKFVIWLLTPSPTGLEGMPQYSSSLGCLKAPHIYNGAQTTYSVPIGIHGADHSIDITGQAVGTLVIAQGASDAADIKYELTLRTDNEALLGSVTMKYPTADEINEGLSESRVHLSTPGFLASSCMRYDMTLYVPPNLKKLHVQAHSVAQIKFDDESNIDMDSLFVTMYTLDENNMLLPHSGVHAGELALEMVRGWLVGHVAIVDKTTLTTQRGDAVLNVHVTPAPSTAEPPDTAVLQTTTGAGRSDIFYINHRGHPHRPISSEHLSSRNGDVYLTYKEAEFNGTVDLSAKSFTAKGLQGAIHRDGDELPWVGDKNGGDKIVASSRGWMGLYF